MHAGPRNRDPSGERGRRSPQIQRGDVSNLVAAVSDVRDISAPVRVFFFLESCGSPSWNILFQVRLHSTSFEPNALNGDSVQ
jgi:hypothetical protein